MTAQSNIITVSEPAWTNEAEKAVADAWKARVEKVINSDKITKAEYTQIQQGTPEAFSSQDVSLIARWKELLPKLRCGVIPFELYVGGSAKLTFYEGETALPLFDGEMTDDIIWIEEGKTDYMLHIDNIGEVKDELTSIIKAMGVTDYYNIISD